VVVLHGLGAYSALRGAEAKSPRTVQSIDFIRQWYPEALVSHFRMVVVSDKDMSETGRGTAGGEWGSAFGPREAPPTHGAPATRGERDTAFGSSDAPPRAVGRSVAAGGREDASPAP
jgi:hypothetical protein